MGARKGCPKKYFLTYVDDLLPDMFYFQTTRPLICYSSYLPDVINYYIWTQ